MSQSRQTEINAPNLWRLETPGHKGWQRTARAGDPNKYFMVSTDSHANEPADLWATRIDPKYRDRVPRIITDEQGVQWRYCEGYRPDRGRVMSFEGGGGGRPGGGGSSVPIPTACCRWRRSRPAIWKARWPKLSGPPRLVSARCRCPASRSG